MQIDIDLDLVKRLIEMSSKSGLYSRSILIEGMKYGIPIGLGYFAVGFSLGVFGRTVGISPLQALVSSLLTNASAGQYANYALIGAGATILEIIAVAFIANIRYILMSTALAQRLSPDTPFFHRLILGNYITDELFAISILRDGPVNPYFTYGAVLMASPMWAAGTTLGVIAGDVLPGNITGALSVALYGMFLAIIIPAAKKNRVVLGAIVLSALSSYLLAKLPIAASLSEGTRVIILTIGISTLVALLFPVRDEEADKEVPDDK